MILQRAATMRPVAAPRAQPRRGTFALEPVEALPRLSERVARLAERSLEPNPFFLPEFLAPAMQALGGKGLKLAAFFDREDLRLFAPVIVHGGRFIGAPKLSVWTHPYAPLGAPLIERDMGPQAGESMIAHLKATGRKLLSIPELPLEGPVSRYLQDAARRQGFAIGAAREFRPILHAHAGEDPRAFDQMVSQRRRRELDRQLRRLCDTGSVSFMSATSPSDVEAAFNLFIALEASGWKGRRGTALQRRRAIHDFAHAAVMRLAQNGRAAIDILRVGDRPVAALIRLDHAGLSIPWKIAFDEDFSGFSPGRQLICDETRRWLRAPGVRRVDPVCEEGNALFAGLWQEREPYGTLLIAPRRLGIGARLRAGMMNMRSAGKRQARALLRGNRRRKRRAVEKA
jgi:hypothetical protein